MPTSARVDAAGARTCGGGDEEVDGVVDEDEDVEDGHCGENEEERVVDDGGETGPRSVCETSADGPSGDEHADDDSARRKVVLLNEDSRGRAVANDDGDDHGDDDGNDDEDDEAVVEEEAEAQEGGLLLLLFLEAEEEERSDGTLEESSEDERDVRRGSEFGGSGEQRW